jgi:putative polyhydroxyalkanoate system protein
MRTLHIHRDHALGLARARALSRQWIEQAESRFELDCQVIEGEDSDTIEFSRSGISGRFAVAADHFDLEAKLGLLLGALGKKIESEIATQLDALLETEASNGVVKKA